MRSFQEKLAQFTGRNVRIVAISVDPPETSRNLAEKRGYTFPLLSDVNAEVIRKYDLLHAAGYEGRNISRPGEFLLDPGGIVRWRDLTENYRVRVKPDAVLQVLDELGVKP